MSSLEKHKAVFLDRDGVIFEEVDHLWKIEEARFLPDTQLAPSRIPRSYLRVIVTNQAGIAKGLYRIEDFERLNQWMMDQLSRMGIMIHGVYFCPHHPSGTISKYRKICACRKPNPGMMVQASKELSIDLSSSWFIGDKTSDILAGTQAGCRTILVSTGYGGKDGLHTVDPDFSAKTLTDAVNIICNN